MNRNLPVQPTNTAPLKSRAVRSTCPYCGVGCGVSVHQTDGQGATITGDTDHPANRGNLCLKGQTLSETLSLDDRLLYPSVYGERSTWDGAITHIADKFRRTIDAYGPDAVAFYVSGQLLTEDYYVVNKFVKGYLGTANIDTNSRLCMASSVAGHKRAFGSDTVPGCYEDLELADLVVLVGSNLAWCHPVLFNRLQAARESNQKLRVINIDPRRTATADLADTNMPVKPDSDTALFDGLLRWLAMHGYADESFIKSATAGLDAALTAANHMDIKTVAQRTGLSEEAVHTFYQRFADCDRVVTVYSQGVNQSVGGTDKVNAIINCHLYTGRIGKPGCGPFSVTGQPNAMGGRETGGLANTLTCHMELNNPDHRRIVQQYWQSPGIANTPGLTAVDLFNAIHAGSVKALWIMATNPLVSLPDSNFIAAALQKCDFVVQSDVVLNNDTSDFAHVRLPALAWGEKDGTVTNSERCISRQRQFLPAPGDARPDWYAVAAVADKLGYKNAFDYTSPHEIFAEYAGLSGRDNRGSRDFDISAYQDITAADYSNLKPFYWPARDKISTAPLRFFSDGRFYTPDHRAQFIVTVPIDDKNAPPNTLRLNSGRTRDQWHTMTRTGMAPTLANHTAEPFVQINPADARRLKLRTAELAKVSSAEGQIVVRVVVTDTIAPGAAFIPMHWCKPFTNNGKVNALTYRVTDPISKQPALKQATVTVDRLAIAHYGFSVSSHQLGTDCFDYYAKAKCEGGWRYEFALFNDVEVPAFIEQMAGAIGADRVDYNACNDRYSHFAFTGTALNIALIIDRKPVVGARNWLASLLTQTHHRSTRNQLLAAVRPNDREDFGELICNCMEVGSKQIEAAITQRGCNSVLSVSKDTRAGTNCGSCRSDIAAMLKRLSVHQVA